MARHFSPLANVEGTLAPVWDIVVEVERGSIAVQADLCGI